MLSYPALSVEAHGFNLVMLKYSYTEPRSSRIYSLCVFGLRARVVLGAIELEKEKGQVWVVKILTPWAKILFICWFVFCLFVY